MKNSKPLILISNDDGYHAKGINCLIEWVRDFGDVIVCAPERARSGFACAFSATTPLTMKLRRKMEGVEVWSCSGTPVDCVKMALEELCPRKPDLVIGGINHGDNASVNTHYSGTMGVTMEGCMKYIPSVAFSLCDHRDDADFEPLRPYVRKMVQRVLNEGLPQGVCLNINFPLVNAFRGVKVCRMAKGTWSSEVTRCRHPRGYDYWWMVGTYTNDEPEAVDTDNWALSNGYIAITPTQIDVTAYEMLDKMKDWEQ
jgi:5'-nucleotidase